MAKSSAAVIVRLLALLQTGLTASEPVALKADNSSAAAGSSPSTCGRAIANDIGLLLTGRTEPWVSWLLPWLHRPSPLAQSRKAETSGGEADSDHGNGAGVGSRRNGHRSGIRTIVGTHFALTSSRPGHTGMPTQCTRDEDSAENQGPHPSRQSFGTTRRIRPNQAGSHLGSTLNPGGAVLTLGVFRRSRSVACIHADASPSEVLAFAMVPPRARLVKLARGNDCRYCARKGACGKFTAGSAGL